MPASGLKQKLAGLHNYRSGSERPHTELM